MSVALIYQEVFTAIVRLRSNRATVSDAAYFRGVLRDRLRDAAQEAARAGYPTEDVRLVTFAVVGFLDESVFNTRNPVFADWVREPMQLELFGTHLAGEVFFQNVQRLLERQDSAQLADVLEVHALCLLLGFRGKYGLHGGGEIQGVIAALREKIARIRGPQGELAPGWRLPREARKAAGDPWLKRLQWTAAAILALALVMFVGFRLSLASGVEEIAGLVRSL